MEELPDRVTPLWLTTYKIEQIRVLDNKLFQLLGLLAILISLNLEAISPSNRLLVLTVIIAEIGLVVLYLWFIYPRKPPSGGFKLEGEEDRTDYTQFIDALNEGLRRKAKLMKVAYVLFSIALVAVILLLL